MILMNALLIEIDAVQMKIIVSLNGMSKALDRLIGSVWFPPTLYTLQRAVLLCLTPTFDH